MNNERQKDRDISILEYFNVLQQEYLYFELKTKIYPSAKDKEYFRRVMHFKKSKIEDIAEKNSLDSIFISDEMMEEARSYFYNEHGVPNRLGKRDWYFYHKVGTDFSYEGKGVRLQKYDKEKNWAEVINDKEDIIEVSLDVIARIL
jgi:hypothetical protein